MTRTDLFPCPRCQDKHALSWMVVKGQKRVLGVVCSFGLGLGKTTFVRLPKNLVDQMDLNDPAFKELPEHFTSQASKQLEAQQNMGFSLMLMKPGEQRDERPIAFGTSDEPLAPDAESAAMIEPLKQQLIQLKQAIKETQKKIDEMVNARTKLENQERETQAELRKYWTMPLDFGIS